MKNAFGYPRVLTALRTGYVLFAVFSLLVPTRSFGGAVEVNGICEVGNCVTPDTVASGGTTLTALNFTYTFGNGDQYQLLGGFTVSNLGGFSIAAPFSITCLGPSAASGTDVLTIDLLQNVAASITSGQFSEGLRGTFGGTIAGAGSIQGQISYGGKAMPLEGPFSPPNPFQTSVGATQLTGLTTNPLLIDEQRVVTFGAGSGIGAAVNNAEGVPEPGSVTLLGCGLLGLWAGWRMRKPTV